MATHNLSQLLLRNPQLLSATSPLLVNIPPDNFINEYLSLYPQTHISYYSSNFGFVEQINKIKSSSLHTQFSTVYQTKTLHDLVIIAFPKTKAELNFTLAMLANSIMDDATILVVGENKSGIKSLPKLSQKYLNHCNKVDSARHCLLYCAVMVKPSKAFELDDWYEVYTFEQDNISLNVASLPGVFSQKEIDVGTQLLLANIPNNLTGQVLDFACGAGVIACFTAKKNPQTQLTLIDVSALALTSSEKTLALNGLKGTCLASDSLSHVEGKFDHILSNPPFHQGVKTNYQATESFLKSIKDRVNRHGSITIVANSFLKYQSIMEQYIGNTQLVAKNNGFSIYHCNLK